MVSAFHREETGTNREPFSVEGGADQLSLTGKFSLTPKEIGALFWSVSFGHFGFPNFLNYTLIKKKMRRHHGSLFTIPPVTGFH